MLERRNESFEMLSDRPLSDRDQLSYKETLMIYKIICFKLIFFHIHTSKSIKKINKLSEASLIITLDSSLKTPPH